MYKNNNNWYDERDSKNDKIIAIERTCVQDPILRKIIIEIIRKSHI